MYFFRQEYILNPHFSSWRISKQPAEFLELSTFAINLSLNSQQCFQKPFRTISKTKQPPKQTKNQQRPKDHSLSENKDL